MKRSIASRGAFAILAALPLLPVCGIMVDGPPVVVFFSGGISFISGVMLLVWLLAYLGETTSLLASAVLRAARPTATLPIAQS
jgi:hypothetical protein